MVKKKLKSIRKDAGVHKVWFYARVFFSALTNHQAALKKKDINKRGWLS